MQPESGYDHHQLLCKDPQGQRQTEREWSVLAVICAITNLSSLWCVDVWEHGDMHLPDPQRLGGPLKLGMRLWARVSICNFVFFHLLNLLKPDSRPGTLTNNKEDELEPREPFFCGNS